MHEDAATAGQEQITDIKEPEIEIIQKEVDDIEDLHKSLFDTSSDISSATVMDNNAMGDDGLLDTNQDLHEPPLNHASDISHPLAVENNMNEKEEYNSPDTNDGLHPRRPSKDDDAIPPLTVGQKKTEDDDLLNTNQHPHTPSPTSGGDRGISPPVATESHGQEEGDGLLQAHQDSEQSGMPHAISGSVTEENSMDSTAIKSALPSPTKLPFDAAECESNGTSTNIEHQETSSENPVQPFAPVLQTRPALATDKLREDENLGIPTLPEPLTIESAVPLPLPEVGPENVEKVIMATGISQVPEKHDTPPTLLESGPDPSSLGQTAAPSISNVEWKPSLTPAGEAAPNQRATNLSDIRLPNAEQLDGLIKSLNNILALPTPQTAPVSLPIPPLDASEETEDTAYPPPPLDIMESPTSTAPVDFVPPPFRRLPMSGTPSTCPNDVAKDMGDWTTVSQECVILLGLIMNPEISNQGTNKSLEISRKKLHWLMVIRRE